jgi:thiol-disulfide isomerase/thioredoxin
MRPITQASLDPVPSRASQARSPTATNAYTATSSSSSKTPPVGVVHIASSLRELDTLLSSASKSCAVVFFTSSTCPPCKLLYPIYDELAAEAGMRAVLIKVDVGIAYDAGAKYSIRATPTFITFLKGEKENEWKGADEGQLRGNFRLLQQMAWPPHPHSELNLPVLLSTSLHPVTYSKLPPLDKLIAKMGDAGNNASVVAVKEFVTSRNSQGAAGPTLPDLAAFSQFLRESIKILSKEVIFAVVDLFRVALVDSRLSGFYAEEKDHTTVASLIQHTLSIRDCPYPLRLVTIQAACNLFTSPLFPEHIVTSPALTTPITELITTSLLDVTHNNIRVAAASLAFNIAAYVHKQRIVAQREVLPMDDQVALVASLLEAINNETDSSEAMKGLLLALGFLVFSVPQGGELEDLLRAMDASGTVRAKSRLFKEEPLVKEIGEELLDRGLSLS